MSYDYSKFTRHDTLKQPKQLSGSSRVATDAEWQDGTGWVSTSFVADDHTVHTYITNKLRQYATFDDPSRFTFLDSSDDILRQYLTQYNITAKNIDLLMFYSPKDLEYATTQGMMKKLYKDKVVDQTRLLKGKFAYYGRHIKLHDLKGWAAGNLKALSVSVGVEMVDKGLMDEYKSHMLDGYKENFELALKYAEGDAKALLEIDDAFRNNTNKTREVLGLDTKDSLPYTTGSLVASAFEDWLNKLGGERYHFALNKLGTPLDQTELDKYDKAVKVQDLHTINHVVKYQDRAYSQSTVKVFASITDTTSCFNAIVQGGRCVNERPSESRVLVGADIDLQSCYGSTMRSLIYPIGLPTTWKHTPQQKPMTLGVWLDKNKNELVDELWQVVVEGTLPFHQDLVFSKLTNKQKINRSVHIEDDGRDDDDVSRIEGEFTLLRKEIKYGIITSDVLRTIKAVAANQELGKWMNLKVVCGAAYLKKHMYKDVDAWTEHVIWDKGKNLCRNMSAERTDTRTKAWLAVPLETFVGVLVDRRNDIKKQMKPRGRPHP